MKSAFKVLWICGLLVQLLSLPAAPANHAWAAEGPEAAAETALSSPRQPETLSAGLNVNCVVQSDGTLACWGRNDYGQAAPPAGVFTQVSAGALHSCGLRGDGALVCWGLNNFGQAMPPAGVFIQVSASGSHTCGVRSDGTLACWGNNDDGQAAPPSGVFTQVSAGEHHTCGVRSNGTLACWGYNYVGQATPPAGVFTQVSAGGYHSCGVRDDGTLACWGGDYYGQANPPAGTFTQVSAGGHHTCGLQSDGTLACWGRNIEGQASPPMGVFTQVSAGHNHTCGLRADGTLACWGSNGDNAATPPDGSLFGQRRVSAGWDFTCGVRSNGALFCWGENGYGQAIPPAGEFIQVSAGFWHACGLRGDGTLACWGSDDYGQAMPPSGTFSQVSAGFFHSCGLRSNGTLACWGYNGFGQATPPSGIFTQVSVDGSHSCGLGGDGTLTCWGDNGYGQATPPTGTFTQVSVGFSHTCGLRSDGTLACWGDDTEGQSTPPSGTFTQISAGALHTCGLRDNGQLLCWGYNEDGQATPPVGEFTQAGAGAYHSCALRADGTLNCWGDNQIGQAPRLSISPTSLPEGQVDSAYSQTLIPSGGLGPYSFSIAGGTPPPGLSLGTDGLLAGTPSVSGTYNFTVQLVDSWPLPLSVEQSFSLYINPPPNRAPICQGVTLETNEDTVGTAAPVCTDADNDALTYSIASQPAHGTAAVVGGQLQYTPAGDYNGSDSFSYTASDAEFSSAPVVASVSVSAVNDAPVCQAVLLSTDEDTPGSTAPNCSDVDGDLLSYAITSQPSHGLAVVVGGSLQYTPASDYNGVDGFTYRASDGVLSSASAAVSVTVRPVNDAPVCQVVNLNTEEDTVGTAAPQCMDLEGDPLSYRIAEQPVHGAAAVAGGLLQYTPETDYNGLDNFTYLANDGSLDSAPALVNVSVGLANDLPTAVDDAALTDEDTPVLIEVLANDSDPDGGVLSVIGASNPAHGAVEIHADGTITYTPVENYYGSDGFTYDISDGQGGADQAAVTISVRPVNDAPTAVEDTYQTRYLTPLFLSPLEGLLANDSDVEGDPLSAVLISGPAHGQLTLNPDGSLTYTPDASAITLDSFTYAASDGAANSAATTVTIVIEAQYLFLPLVMK